MYQEKIVWTALPNGLITLNSTKYLKLTLFVSPRLYGSNDTTLGNSAFADFLHWPQRVAGLTFKIKFLPGPTIVTAIPDPSSPRLDESMWTYLFQASTFVKHYEYQDYSDRFVITHPTSAVNSFVEGTYKTVVSTYPNQLPSINGGTDGNKLSLGRLFTQFDEANFLPMGGGPESKKNVLEVLNQYKNSKYGSQRHTFPPPASGDSVEAIKQLQLFYYRPEDYHPAQNLPRQVQKLDFHEMVSSLNKYPELLRRLGLAVDLLIPFNTSGLPMSTPSATVQLNNSPISSSTDIRPRTHFTLNSSEFIATSSSGEVKQGMLDLTLKSGGNPVFELHQLDVDGSAIKLIGLLKQLQTMENSIQTIGVPNQIGLPALRSGGIRVVQNGRAANLTQVFPVALNNNSMAEGGTGANVSFHAEDLTRGFRVDMWDSETGKWHSLHLRGPAFDETTGNPYAGSYQFVHAPSGHRYFTPARSDENFVSMGVTQDPSGASSGGSSPDLYLHESLWRWAGWSLAAQRPGKNLAPDDSAGTSDNTPGPGVGLVTHFGPAKGTLPRLRFGVNYRLRARVVDLAGNSVPHTSTNDTYELPLKAQAPLMYRRFEAIVAPATVLRKDISGSPGESTDRLVIRSDFSVKPGPEAVFLNSLHAGVFHPDSERHIAPPRMAQLMAEMHKLFDGLSPADSYNLITQYDNSFDPSTVEDSNSLPIPYLPELLSRGTAFTGLPGVPGIYKAPFSVPAGKSWPLVQGFRLVLNELEPGTAPKPPAWTAPTTDGQGNPVDGVLTVFLAKGRVATVQLSSYLSAADVNIMGIWGWMEDLKSAGKITAAQLSEFKTEAELGQIWSLTPFRQLTLVNAIQQPFIQPKFSKLQAARIPVASALGETYAVLIDEPMTIDGPSTIKLDVEADWTQLQDDLTINPSPTYAGVPGPALPTTIHGHAHVVEMPIEALPVEFASWAKPASGNQATVYFPAQASKATPGAEVDISGMNPPGLNGTFKVISSTVGSVTFALANNPGPFVAGGTIIISEVRFSGADDRRHNFGDTKYRRVNYWAIATTRFLEYFPDNKIATSPLTVTNASWSAGNATLLFDPQPVAPGFGQKLVVAGMKPTGYNGNNYKILSSTTTSVTYALANNPGTFVNGGTVIAGDIVTTRTSPVKTVDVLSTARPAAPNQLYAVPAFDWADTSTATTSTSTRTGGWLRVYLDRPWYSSGDGELLGVVVVNQLAEAARKPSRRVSLHPGLMGRIRRADETTGVPGELKSYVTQWGQDPLWASPEITAPPLVTNFPSAVATHSNLYLDELGGRPGAGAQVAVAGHTVHYDQDRSLWYSDIQFKWGTSAGESYFPFVRLALARYQPNSISNPDTVHLSRVVLADFAQLTPTRVAEVMTHISNQSANYVKLVVSGPTYSEAMGFQEGPQLEVTVEQQMPQVSGELGWVPVPNSTHALPQTALNNQNVATWSVGFDLPHPVGSVPYRLIIKEHELYLPEPQQGSGALKPRAVRGPVPTAPRLVYASVLQI